MSQFPTRPTNSLSGSQFIASIEAKDFGGRDDIITAEIINGNFPKFMRNLVPISVEDKEQTLIYYVTPDYLGVGDDADFIRVPLSGSSAQKIANAFGCLLPTSKMSNQIWQSAATKVAPTPLSGITSNISGKKYTPQEFLKEKLSDTDSFAEHNRLIQEQLNNHSNGKLVAGHKKDVIISNELNNHPGKVAIHGMHDIHGKPIQGKSWKHNIDYRDYSHGIRLVDKQAKLNGKQVDLLKDILQNPQLAHLVSDEGALTFAGYNNSVPKGTSVKGRISLLDRLSDYIDKINKSI